MTGPQVDPQSYSPADAVRARATLSSRRRGRWLAPYALLAPAGLFLGVLIAATLMILRLSFGLKSEESAWTLENYAALGQHLYASSIFLTLKLAFLSAVIVVVLGFPIAMFLTRIRNEGLRRSILLALLLPLLMSTLLQAYGWMIIMAPAGILGRLAQSLRLTSGPLLLMFNQTGVLIGLVHGSFPIAVLPIASALRNIPKSLEEAAGTLGANRLRVLWHVVFPLSLPGVVSASLLVFGWNASALVIPYLLGGRRVPMLALLILDQMGAFLDWPFGSANAMVLVIITLIILAVYQQITLRYLNLWRA